MFQCEVATHYISNLDNFEMPWDACRTVWHPTLGSVACGWTVVLNGTAGIGASERIHVPMNQRGIGFVQLLQIIYMYICIDFNVLWMKPHVSVLQPTIYLLQMSC